MAMIFQKIDGYIALDVVAGWEATNTGEGCSILKNTKGQFELWALNPSGQPLSQRGLFKTFNKAVREAECIFDIIVPAS